MVAGFKISTVSSIHCGRVTRQLRENDVSPAMAVPFCIISTSAEGTIGRKMHVYNYDTGGSLLSIAVSDNRMLISA